MATRLATHSWSVRRSLAAREPFATHGAFRAVEGGVFDTGRLPEPYRSAYLDAWSDARITYTVLSYRTPIAWVLEDGEVIIPPVKYSVTTSGHQGLLYALDQRPGDFPEDTPRQRPWTPTHAPGARSWPRADRANPPRSDGAWEESSAWERSEDASHNPVDLAYSADFARAQGRADMSRPSITIHRSYYQLDDVVDGDIRYRSTCEDTEQYDGESGRTPIQWASDLLDETGATEPSSYPEVQVGITWYSGTYTLSPYTYEQSEVDVSAHLFGFSPDEERAIYRALSAHA